MKNKNLIGCLILILVIMLTMMYFHGRNNYDQGFEEGYENAIRDIKEYLTKSSLKKDLIYHDEEVCEDFTLSMENGK